jgi:hypothetical protein
MLDISDCSKRSSTKSFRSAGLHPSNLPLSVYVPSATVQRVASACHGYVVLIGFISFTVPPVAKLSSNLSGSWPDTPSLLHHAPCFECSEMKRSKESLPPADQISRLKGALRSDTDISDSGYKWLIFSLLKSPRIESCYGHWAVGSASGDYNSAKSQLSNEHRVMTHAEAVEFYESLLEQRWIPYSHKSLVAAFEVMLVRVGLKAFKQTVIGRTPPGGEYKCNIEPVRQRPLNWLHQLNDFRVFWKNPEDRSKGTIWLYLSKQACDLGGILNHEKGVPFGSTGIRTSLALTSGITWTATWEDGTSYRFKASPQAGKKLMAAIASRWGNPPVKLQKDKARPFSLSDLKDESHSHVYLVRLLTFDDTADGRAYYKIGKAISVPRRIKQFGPCELIDEVVFSSEAMSLQAEAALHAQFDVYRKLGTEIFVMNAQQLAALRTAFQSIRDKAT